MGSARASLVVLLAQLVSLQVAASTYTFQGEGTSYNLGEPSGGNCNFMNYPAAATTNYAALNAAQWDSTMNCGRCAQVKCTDALCTSQQSEIVYIVDQCPGCEDGDLDLSPEVFESITGLSYTRVSIEWSFVDCPVSGNIEYCLKTGSNSFWTAVQPTNVVSGVKSLTINGKATTMVSSAYYFLLDGNSQDQTDLSQVTISMFGVNGEMVEDTVSFASESCVEGSSQFSTGNPASEDDYALYTASKATSTSSTTTASTDASTSAPTSTPSVAPTATPTETPTTPTPTPTPTQDGSTSSDDSSNSSNPSTDPVSVGQSDATQDGAASTSTAAPTSTPAVTILRANTKNVLQTTPTIIGLSVAVLVAVVAVVALVLYGRRKKRILEKKLSGEEADDRLPTMLSPRSPSVSSAYHLTLTPTPEVAEQV